MTRRQGAALVIKAGVSVALILLVVRSVDLSASFAVMTRLALPALLAASGLVAAATLITALRWWWVLRQLVASIPLAAAVRLMFVGNFFSQMLPSSVGGDAVRIWYVRHEGVPTQRAIGSVLLERACGLLGLALLVAAGMVVAGPGVDPAVRFVLLAGLPVAAAGFAVVCLADRWAWLARADWLAPVKSFAADTRRIVCAGSFGGLLALSIAAQLCMVLAVFTLASGLGIRLALFDAVTLVPGVLLAMVIPLSVAGWGVREGAMVVMLAFAGVPGEAALAISLLLGLSMIAATLPGLAFWLAGRTRPLAAGVS